MSANSLSTPRITFWTLAITAACVCVFLFSLQAKLAQYEGPPSTVTPVKAAKLWNADGRIEIQNPEHVLVLPTLAVVLLLVFTLAKPSSVLLAVPETPASLSERQLWNLRRFFRPPPVR